MEGLLKAISKVMPLVPFYPRWAQMLFLATMGIALTFVFVLVAWYPAAARRQADAVTPQFPPDVKAAIDQTIDTARVLYSDLGLSLTEYYTSVVSLHLHLGAYTRKRPAVRDYVEEPLPTDLKNDVSAVIGALNKVNSALAAIQRRDFALRCWNGAVRAHKADALASIKTQMIAEGFSARASSIAISDIPALMQFLSLAERGLGEFTFGRLLTAVLATNSADIEKVGKGYNNAALRSLIFGGNLIFAFVTTAPAGTGEGVVASWGTGILLDVFRAIPDAAVVREELKKLHPQQAGAIDRLSVDLDPETLVSSDLRGAVEVLEKRTDLLFLLLPK